MVLNVSSALAGERVINYDIFKNNFELHAEAKNFKIWDIGIENVVKTRTITEDDDCRDDDTFSCSRREVIEKVKVLQLVVEYDSYRPFSTDETPYDYLEVNLPLDSISAEDLEIIKANAIKRSLDLLGKRTKARIEVAKKNFTLLAKDKQKTISEVDYDNSRICDISDWLCQHDDIRYKTKVTKVKELSILKK
jgi:hypothetical protein